ncbi:hypothetical protein [Arthrobacter sp. A2-55]|uniref:hypothetical protein n=1 Tax=Arthrobacter sp. A2-55 TaxID=2897337 RepID=UPI0021CD2E0B|nr:hypothetical protein [Arthrobacter sp. A2-55]MCU6480500.1 hypothetical protein [Arthrobacter sp. A2-55]
MNTPSQRHQLHWRLENGRYAPKLTCLHEDVPGGQRCDGDAFVDEPESLVCDDGAGHQIRDGIIVSQWEGASPWPDEGDDGAALHWRYEDEHLPVSLQRHTVRFLLAAAGGFDLIEPAFDCLHGPVEQCHAQAWREDLTLFPEWHAGSDVPLRAGAIVSWWPNGPSDHSLPGWDYEEHGPGALLATLSGVHR